MAFGKYLTLPTIVCLLLVSSCESVNIPISKYVESNSLVASEKMIDEFVGAAKKCGYTEISNSRREVAGDVFYGDARVKLERGYVIFSLAKIKDRNVVGLIYGESARWKSEGYSAIGEKYISCLLGEIQAYYPKEFKTDGLL